MCTSGQTGGGETTCKLIVGSSCDGNYQFPPPNTTGNMCMFIDGQEPEIPMGTTFTIPLLNNVMEQGGDILFTVEGMMEIPQNPDTDIVDIIPTQEQCPIYGCTDPLAQNTDPIAQVDDGS